MMSVNIEEWTTIQDYHEKKNTGNLVYFRRIIGEAIKTQKPIMVEINGMQEAVFMVGQALVRKSGGTILLKDV
tara:strand:+ start:308 stop:526 length:219 start_codon:yes stop_codon:yes gene_type:complete